MALPAPGTGLAARPRRGLRRTLALDAIRFQLLAARALKDLAAAQSALLVYVGDRLGLYRAMAGAGPVTPAELARRTGVDERYLEEWLANQAASGWVASDAKTGRFELTEEQAALFADPSSPAFQGGAYQLCVALAAAAPLLERAFRDGSGIAPEAFGPAVADAIRRTSEARLGSALVSRWIPAMDGVEDSLRDGVEVADVGCGAGVATLLLARAFPRSRFVGFDVDADALRAARRAAEQAGLEDRVSFRTARADDFPGEGYRLVLAIDVIHETPDAAAALARIRRALDPEGALLVAEPDAADGPTDVGPAGRRLVSAVSTAYCLPVSRAEGGRGRGALRGERDLRELLGHAGFADPRRLPSGPIEIVLECRPGSTPQAEA